MTELPAHFTIEATFGDATIKGALRSDLVDQAIEDWQGNLQRIGNNADRSDVRQFVTDALMNERHQEPDVGEAIISALVWLAATSEYGEKLLPMMRKGSAAIGFEITRVGPTTFNFRMSVDDETGKAIA